MSIVEIHKSIVEINKSIVEINKSIVEINKSIVEKVIVRRESNHKARKYMVRCPTVHVVSGCSLYSALQVATWHHPHLATRI